MLANILTLQLPRACLAREMTQELSELSRMAQENGWISEPEESDHEREVMGADAGGWYKPRVTGCRDIAHIQGPLAI